MQDYTIATEKEWKDLLWNDVEKEADALRHALFHLVTQSKHQGQAEVDKQWEVIRILMDKSIRAMDEWTLYDAPADYYYDEEQ